MKGACGVSLIGIAIYSLGCVSGLFAMTAPVGTGHGTMKKAALSRSCCRIFNDGLFSFPSLNRIDDIADFPKPLGHASAPRRSAPGVTFVATIPRFWTYSSRTFLSKTTT
jgi:hypothetical protein